MIRSEDSLALHRLYCAAASRSCGTFLPGVGRDRGISPLTALRLQLCWG